MQLVLTADAVQSATGSLTARQFGGAVSLALATIAIGCLMYGLETGLLGQKPRLVENPVDVMMRTLGLAHFIVGWLFLFTSRRLRSAGAVARLGGATALGVVLCLAFAQFNSNQQPLAVLLFYSFFLVHEIGDEAELFQAYGDGPERSPETRAMLASLSRSVSLLAIAVLVVSHLLFALAIGKTVVLDQLHPTLVASGVTALLACCGWACYRTIHLGRQQYGQMRMVLTLYQPLFIVYAGLLAILALGSFLGSVGLNLVILVHVCAWLVSAHYHLTQRAATAPLGLWTWLRATPTGFLTLHIGMALAVLLLLGLRIHVWERAGFASSLLSKSSFTYWSIMHICMSFSRPR